MTTPPPPPAGQPQPYPQQPGYYQQPPKKRKIWPWVLGGVVLVFILFFAGCMALFGGVANEIDKESKSTVNVTYKVTGDGGSGSITYTDANLNMAQDTQASLPWEKEVAITGLGKIASLTATNDFNAGSSTSITCEILVDGQVKYTQTGTGPGASASCSGDVSD